MVKDVDDECSDIE
jgi:hypothetical protein